MPAQTPSNPASSKAFFKPGGRGLARSPADKTAGARAEKASNGADPGAETHSHTVVFEHDDKSCSQSLFDMIQAVPPEGLSLRALLHLLGERGLLMACMIFAIPSLLPIPLPGMSVPQGVIIGLISLGILLNRSPFLPERMLEYRLPHRSLFLVLEKGVQLFSRIEKLSYPRLPFMTQGSAMRVANAVLLVAGALLLGAPLPIPFSNVIPAYGILFLAFGTLNRDGWLVLAGYLMMVLTVLYMGLVFFFGIGWITSLFR